MRIGKIIKNQLQIMAGVFLFAAGNIIFAVPNHISAGGITGLSMLLYYKLHWNIGLVYFLLNVPLFLLAWRLSKPLFIQSLGSMILCSALIGSLAPLSDFVGIKAIWPGSIVGGVIMGAGLGMMGAANSTLGGGTLAGKMLAVRFGFPFSLSTFMIDVSVYPFFYIFLGEENMWFSLLLTLCSACGIYLSEQISGSRRFKLKNVQGGA